MQFRLVYFNNMSVYTQFTLKLFQWYPNFIK